MTVNGRCKIFLRDEVVTWKVSSSSSLYATVGEVIFRRRRRTVLSVVSTDSPLHLVAIEILAADGLTTNGGPAGI